MKQKKLIWGLVALAVAVAVLVGVYLTFMPKGAAGAKKIQVTIVHSQAQGRTVELTTQQEYLRGALEEQNLVQGEESAYGLFVKTVDGYTVQDAQQEWWCFTKGGETVMTGVDTTPIADGDKFEITLKQGY